MKINVQSTDKIAAALESVNGRAAAHTMQARDVPALAARVEADLESRGVPKKDMRGVAVTYCPAGPGKAYSRKARYVISTAVTLERGPSGWFMVACHRAEPWSDAPEKYVLTLTDAAKAAVLKYALRNVAD